MFHCAVRQEGVDIAFFLSKAFAESNISLHYFRSLDELLILSQRYHLDLASIAGDGAFDNEL